MTRLGMLIRTEICHGCDTCLQACKDEFVGNDYLPYSAAQPETRYGFNPSQWPEQASMLQLYVQHGHTWMKDSEITLGKFPHVKSAFVYQPCHQCENAPCMKAATGGAVYRRNDGIVIIDPTSSQGQQAIVSACPYGRVYWNSETNIPQKCTFCAHLVDQGKNPKCVDACPVHAIFFGDLDDPNSEISTKIVELKAEPLHPEYGTRPKVYYSGLPKPFLSGKVVNGRTGKYIEGATVKLSDMEGGSWTAYTDNYADFEFKNLKVGQMYSLEVTKAGMRPKKIMVYLDQAKDIGKMQLFPEGV